MYVPEHYKLGDVGEQHALMRAYPFAALITTSTPRGATRRTASGSV